MAKIKNPVTVVQSGGTTPTLVQKTFTQNGTYAAANETLPANGYDEVVVNVPPTLFRSVVDKTIETVTANDLSGVSVIGEYAFYKCQDLRLIEIPSSVTQIKERAFANCPSLELVIVHPENPPTLNLNTFQSSTNAMIFAENANAYYAATNWASRLTGPLLHSENELSDVDLENYYMACIVSSGPTYTVYEYNGDNKQWEVYTGEEEE